MTAETDVVALKEQIDALDAEIVAQKDTLATAVLDSTTMSAVAAANLAQITALNTAATSSATASDATLSTNLKNTALSTFVGQQIAADGLAAVSAALHRSPNAITAMFIYDVTNDSDGGAWTEKCQGTSWMTEPLCPGKWLGQHDSETSARNSGAVLGPNLVVNGDLTAGTASWTTVYGSFTSVDGVGVLANTSTTSSYAHQTINTVVSKVYAADFEFIKGSAALPRFQVGTSSSGNQLVLSQLSASGKRRAVFAATTTSSFVNLQVNSGVSGDTASFDNVSVCEILSQTTSAGDYYQSTTDGKFYKLNAGSGTTQVYRGNKAKFPKLVAIVTEANSLSVYDLTEAGQPMHESWYTAEIGNLQSLFALNGVICVGSVSGLLTLDLANDTGNFIQAGNNRRVPMTSRNAIQLIFNGSNKYIVNDTVNDVTAVVLPGAPVNLSTGLGIPTIAVATPGGVSVIKHDGTVQSTAAAATATLQIDFFGNTLVAIAQTRIRCQWDLAMTLPVGGVANLNNYWAKAYWSGSVPATLENGAAQKLSKFGVACNLGLTKLKEHPVTQAKGMVAYITNAYNTGWMPGDIRGAWLADTVAEVISGNELTTPLIAGGGAGWSQTGTGSTVIAFVDGGITIDTDGLSSGAASFTGVAVAGRAYQVKITTTGTGQLKLVYGGPEIVFTDSLSVRVVYGTTGSAFLISRVVNQAASRVITSISITPADADRSVKGNGLAVVGTLNKTAVASGAALVAYSGFSTSNYLEQPYNANLDFGTGDFCVMGWITAADYAGLFDRSEKVAGSYYGKNGIVLYSKGPTGAAITISDSAGGIATAISSTQDCSGPTFILAARLNGILYLWINAQLVASAPNTTNVSNGAATCAVGATWYNGAYTNFAAGFKALVRVSATVPSADQIAQIYRDELPLFQQGAQCTLPSSGTVLDVDYDAATDVLAVSQSAFESKFKGLTRISSVAPSAGAFTGVKTASNVKISSRITATPGVDIDIAAYNFRDEFSKKKSQNTLPEQFEFDAIAAQTTFDLPQGYSVSAVMVNGQLQRLGATKDYTIINDGFKDSVLFSVAPGASAYVLIMAIWIK